jgi:hypothetical protein
MIGKNDREVYIPTFLIPFLRSPHWYLIVPTVWLFGCFIAHNYIIPYLSFAKDNPISRSEQFEAQQTKRESKKAQLQLFLETCWYRYDDNLWLAASFFWLTTFWIFISKVKLIKYHYFILPIIHNFCFYVYIGKFQIVFEV